MTTIQDVAEIVRSKNAGPFRLTVDVFFESTALYEEVVDADVLKQASVAEVYGIDESAIIGIYELDRINAVKITFTRPIAAGSLHDSDVYGSQQHQPLLGLEIR